MWDEATNSTAVFRSWIAGVVEPEFIGAWLQPDVRYILTAWTDQVTPDRNASIPASAYGQGEWQAAREVIDTGAGNRGRRAASSRRACPPRRRPASGSA